MNYRRREVLLRVVAGLLLVGLLVSVANYKFGWALFNPYDRQAIAVVGLAIFLVLFASGSLRAYPLKSAGHDPVLEGGRSGEKYSALGYVAAVLAIIGLVIFNVVPKYFRGEVLVPRDWLVLGAAVAVAIWALIHRGGWGK